MPHPWHTISSRVWATLLKLFSVWNEESTGRIMLRALLSRDNTLDWQQQRKKKLCGKVLCLIWSKFTLNTAIACTVSLDTGRYTWRHNCVINYIVNSCHHNYIVYSDLSGHRGSVGGSLPPGLCVTAEKQDIVMMDKREKKIHPFELTCLSEKHIRIRNTQKRNKYAHFLTDITHCNPTVNCFEIIVAKALYHDKARPFRKYIKNRNTPSKTAILIFPAIYRPTLTIFGWIIQVVLTVRIFIYDLLS